MCKFYIIKYPEKRCSNRLFRNVLFCSGNKPTQHICVILPLRFTENLEIEHYIVSVELHIIIFFSYGIFKHICVGVFNNIKYALSFYNHLDL
jgi:hypothetical protein